MTGTQTKPANRLRLAIPLHSAVLVLLSGFVALSAALVCYLLLQVSLGTIFASIFIVSLISIALSTSTPTFVQATLLAVTVSISSIAPILLALVDRLATTAATFQLLLLCIVISLLLLTGAQLLSRLLGRAIAPAIVLLLWLLWLTYPVWMSHAFATPIGVWTIDHLFAHHPLMAISGAFAPMEDWSHAPIAYKYLTNLGQDVLYARPASAWRAIASHGVLAIAVSILQLRLQRRSDRKISCAPINAE